MKNKKILLGLFIVVAGLQVAVPLYMAWRWEDVLNTGQRFLWQTAPVDPYDAFKGRFIELRFKETSGPVSDPAGLPAGQAVYAIVAVNAAGNAYIKEVSGHKPATGTYLKVRAYTDNRNNAHVVLPFSRFYLPEDIAPAAETAYRDQKGKNGVAAIRIKDGYGVVEQLYIGDKTLREFLRQGPPGP